MPSGPGLVFLDTSDPDLGERKFCFRSLKMYQNSPTAMQNSKFFPGTIPQTFVSGGKGKFVFVLRKCTKSLLQQCKIQKKKSGGKSRTTDPHFWEGEVKIASSWNYVWLRPCLWSEKSVLAIGKQLKSWFPLVKALVTREHLFPFMKS